jgi:hypothetical protein
MPVPKLPKLIEGQVVFVLKKGKKVRIVFRGNSTFTTWSLFRGQFRVVLFKFEHSLDGRETDLESGGDVGLIASGFNSLDNSFS